MDRINIIQIGMCHEHANGKIALLKKRPDIFNLLGYVDERDFCFSPRLPSPAAPSATSPRIRPGASWKSPWRSIPPSSAAGILRMISITLLNMLRNKSSRTISFCLGILLAGVLALASAALYLWLRKQGAARFETL